MLAISDEIVQPPQTVPLLFHLSNKALVNCCRRLCARIFDVASKIQRRTKNGGSRIYIIPDIFSDPVFYLSYDSLRGGVHPCMPPTIFRLSKRCVCSREKDIINFPPQGQIGTFTSCAYIPHTSVSHGDPGTAVTQEKLSDFDLILFFRPAQPQQPLLSVSAIGSTRHRDNVQPGPRWRGPGEAAMSTEPCVWGGSRAAAAPRPGRETLQSYLSPPPAPLTPSPSPVMRCSGAGGRRGS